ncbi:MAG: 30S ribosomal protein S24e [Candidatus Thermoplasmatota archaeon]|jgi:small subunit ribosomal protein S24e|nr:30S ribosomal protein S24e [Candidatus Thermoplasmatota archaeon]
MVDIKIEETKENKLLKRKEIRFTITFDKAGTPKRDIVRDLIAKNTGSKKELVIVDSIKQETGRNEATGYSKVYADKESAMLFEPDYELLRNGLKEKKAE